MSSRYTLDYKNGLESVMVIDNLTGQAIFCGSEETAKQLLATWESRLILADLQVSF